LSFFNVATNLATRAVSSSSILGAATFTAACLTNVKYKPKIPTTGSTAYELINGAIISARLTYGKLSHGTIKK
jgi:hypothetical protein